MKRGPLVLGALASTVLVARGMPALANTFDLASAAAADPTVHKNVAYLTALSFTPALPTPFRADLQLLQPSRVQASVFGIVTAINGSTSVEVYLSQGNSAIIDALVQQVQLPSLAVSGTCLEYTYNLQTKAWQTVTAPFSFSPKTKVNVSLTPVSINSGVAANVYKVTFQQS
jgi:hypothetical protein